MPYHVLHTLGSAQSGFGSFARIVSALGNGLDPERYAVHACFLGESGPVASELEAAGTRVHVLRWRGVRRDPAGTWRVWQALRSQEWAILHLHAGGRSVRWLARAGSRAKLVIHLHALNTSDTEPEGYRPVSKQVSHADVAIASSHAVAKLAVGLRPHVVYPGVRVLENSRPAPETARSETKIVGTACRLVPVKGLVHLVRAQALLRERFPDLCLEIAGSGPAQAELEEEVRSLGLADRVRFLGWQSDMEAVLARWDVFALPSLVEAFGIAALEAMAAGLPVVATAVGGVPELVEDGKTGWLVPPKDAEALADRLRVLLLDPEQRRAMGAAGRARARQHFSIDQMVAGITKIYDDLLGLSGNR